MTKATAPTDELTLAQAATVARKSPNTLRAAIRRGELAARLPFGRDPRRLGRLPGYRITRAALDAYLAGIAPSEATAQ